MERDELLATLSEHLPSVDHLTPEGRLPTEQEASRWRDAGRVGRGDVALLVGAPFGIAQRDSHRWGPSDYEFTPSSPGQNMRLAPYLNTLLMVSQMLRSPAPVSAVISLKSFMCASVAGPAIPSATSPFFC